MKKRSIPDAAKADWSNTGSFMNKPKHGWCHTDGEIARGVTYQALYVGCVKILQSVKSVSLEDRSSIIKIATARCCDKAGFVKYKKKHKIPQTISKAFGDVFTGYRGESVLITISKSSIKIVLERTGVVICDHYIENISFASGGEKEYTSFVSYISKDNIFERACFVIECSADIKLEVIQTIGQAFEAKYKEVVNNPPKLTEVPERFTQPIFPVEEDPAPSCAAQPYASLKRENEKDGAGYSKLHGKEEKPGYAELNCSEARSSKADLNDYSVLERGAFSNQNNAIDYDQLHFDKKGKGRPTSIPIVAGANYDQIQGSNNDFAAVYDNPMASPSTKDQMLVDFNDNSPEYQSIPNAAPSPYDNPKELMAAKPYSSPYDNPKDLLRSKELLPSGNPGSSTHSAEYDVPKVQSHQWEQFDDSTDGGVANGKQFDGAGYLVPTGVTQGSAKYASLKHDKEDSEDSGDYHPPEEVAEYQRPNATEYQPPNTHYQTPTNVNGNRPKSFVGPLDNKPWFHGNISRLDSEMLIEEDGQFLVRESSSNKGQYVLSGMKDAQHRHLLLVDPHGQVRTKDRKFATVEELINFHKSNSIPIISGGSEVQILFPVARKGQTNVGNNSFKI
ncbi:SHC-transforming protein 1-like isoform X1 [Rhopilema esculentum]|uniref:SHC-transforming protein 1-like isoform X1 n=1 Tax=Rhopilema esculentum TaxID=499914 RepID=UPI0031E34EAA